MSEETVSTVLQECGNNIDAAIRRLGELRLTVEDGSPPAEQTQQGPATPQANAATGPDVQTANAGGLEQPAPGPTTAEQWVELLVAEMSAATDLPNAKQRAAGFLRQFEDFVARFVKQQQAAAGGSGGSGSPAAGDPSLAARAAKLAEENAVLKKAVQIQHRQLQERAGLEAETQQLKALLAQYQEQVRTLQVSNYSLSLHLQKATSTNVLGGSRNPDVF